MATFLIERYFPGAADLTPEQLRDIAATSNDVVDGLGVAYTWQRSYVAGDKIYCLHETDNVATVREHARRWRIPGRPRRDRGGRDRPGNRLRRAGLVGDSIASPPVRACARQPPPRRGF